MAAPSILTRKTPLKILQWNCRAIARNIHYLNNYLKEANPQVICLQSPHTTKFKLPQIAGYHFPPTTESNKTPIEKIHTATYIQIEIEHEILNTPVPLHPSQPIYSNYIKIKVPHFNKDINIINTYAPKSISLAGLEWLGALPGDGWIVAGDLNIHHPLWLSSTLGTLKVAHQQTEDILKSNLLILNNGNITRIPDISTHQPTAVDITLISPNLYADATWIPGDDPLGSDHLPINIEINLVADTSPRTIPIKGRFLYDKANWPLYNSHINQNLKEVDTSDVNTFNNTLVKLIIDASEAAIPRSKGAPPDKPANPWWSDNCSKATKVQRNRRCAPMDSISCRYPGQ